MAAEPTPTPRENARHILDLIDAARQKRATTPPAQTADEHVAFIAQHVTALGFPLPDDASPAGVGRLMDVDLERYALMAMVADRAAIEQHISRGITTVDFTLPVHQLIFAAIVALWDKGLPVDMLALDRHLQSNQTYGEFGGKDYLLVVEAVCTDVAIAHAPRWSAIIHDLAQRRRLAGVGPDMVRVAAAAPDVAAAITQTEQILARSIKDTGSRIASSHPGDILGAADDDASVPTPWPPLDFYTGGLGTGQVWTVMGASSHGKTTFVLNIIHLCLRNGMRVAYFNLDSHDRYLLWRLIALEAGVSHADARNGHVLQDHPTGEKVRAARAKFEVGGEWADQLRVYSSFRDLERILAEARRHKAQYGLDLVAVDFLQNLSMAGGKGESEYERMNHAMRDFQQFAQLEECTPVLLSQVAIEQQKGQRVTDAFNGKGSGAIKDDADVSLAIHRDRLNMDDPAKQRLMDVHVLKVKEGPVGVVKLEMDLQSGRLWPRPLAEQPRDYQEFMR